MPRILIVEDDESMAVALKDGFEFEGYEVTLVTDGVAGLREALEKTLGCPMVTDARPSTVTVVPARATEPSRPSPSTPKGRRDSASANGTAVSLRTSTTTTSSPVGPRAA